MLLNQKLEQENMKEFMVKFLMSQKLKQDDGVTDQSVNQSRTTENDSERDVYQVRIQERVETISLFDTGAEAHVMPKYVCGEPTLKTTRDVRGFIGKVKVQVTAVVARDARRCLLRGKQLRTKGYTFTLNQHESFLTQPQGGARVTMSREGNRDTFKVVCMLKPRDAQSVNSLMLKRDLENVRRELRNLKTGQYENKRESAAGEMTVDERITHERTRHATHDPRCLMERRVSTHPRKAVAEAAYFHSATVKMSQQGVEGQDPGRCWTAW